jgi:hypothetical protein
MTEEELIFLIWPELEKYKNTIYQLYPGPGNNFLARDIDEIVQGIISARKLGKTKIVFSNLGEVFLPGMLTKFNEIAEALDGIVTDHNMFYATHSFNGETVYNMFAETHNWKKRITILAGHFSQYSSQYNWREYKSLPPYEVKIKDKMFVCFNRVPRLHRIKLLECMLGNGLLDKSYYSFMGTYNSIEHVPFDIPLIIQNKNLLPINLNVDETTDSPTMIFNGDLTYHNNSYFSLVTETMFYQDHWIKECSMLTEKIFRPIMLQHPFVVLGNCGLLAELQKLGYKTFSPFIDETYDTIESDDDRFAAVVQETERLCAFTNEQWLEWQTSIKEIVEFNKRHYNLITDHRVTKNIEQYFE